jgi:hypothetical protein
VIVKIPDCAEGVDAFIVTPDAVAVRTSIDVAVHVGAGPAEVAVGEESCMVGTGVEMAGRAEQAATTTVSAAMRAVVDIIRCPFHLSWP